MSYQLKYRKYIFHLKLVRFSHYQASSVYTYSISFYFLWGNWDSLLQQAYNKFCPSLNSFYHTSSISADNQLVLTIYLYLQYYLNSFCCRRNFISRAPDRLLTHVSRNHILPPYVGISLDTTQALFIQFHLYFFKDFFFPIGATTPNGGCILQPSSGLQPPRARGFLIT